jgi:hypothetical protein
VATAFTATTTGRLKTNQRQRERLSPVAGIPGNAARCREGHGNDGGQQPSNDQGEVTSDGGDEGAAGQ